MSVVIEEDYSDFDWDSTEGDKPQYTPLPPGWYPARVAKAELKTIEGREGTFNKLALQLEILDGDPHAGRIVFDDIILNNKEGSKKRRAIVWRRLGLVEKGATRASISEQDLVGKQCAIELKITEYTKRDNTKARKNEVTFAGYKPLADLESLRAGAMASGSEGGEATGASDTLDETLCPF
jgi:hypothetical protein